MKSKLCLLLLVVSAIFWLAYPPLSDEIPRQAPGGLWGWWNSSVQSFAFPLAFMILGFSRHFLLKLLQMLWGVWVVILSIAFLFQAEALQTQISAWGFLFVAWIAILASALVLFTVIEISQAPVTQKRS